MTPPPMSAEHQGRERTKRVSVNTCHAHGFYMLAIEDDNGGQRVLGSKCCGHWQAVKTWTPTAEQWRELAQLATAAADAIAARPEADHA